MGTSRTKDADPPIHQYTLQKVVAKAKQDMESAETWAKANLAKLDEWLRSSLAPKPGQDNLSAHLQAALDSGNVLTRSCIY